MKNNFGKNILHHITLNLLKFERETERLCVWLQMLCLFEFSKILSMNEIRSVKMQKQ